MVDGELEERFGEAQSAGRGDQPLKSLTVNVVDATLRFVKEKTACIRRVEAFTYEAARSLTAKWSCRKFAPQHARYSHNGATEHEQR